LEEGKGFQLSQARLGPGRIHHCMRSIGLAEVALALMIERTNARVAFKKQLAEQGSIKQDIARSRIEIENCRLLTLQTAHMIDTAMIKNPKTRQYVGMIKVYVPTACKTIVDRAVQAHGGAGVCQDTPLARMWAGLRTMQLADGPDEVHMVTIGKLEVQARAKFNKAKL
jgi:alkylation response protein AidB-like acyl-CoA dehydrogenase